MALGFYSSVRVEVIRGELIEEDKKVIGQQIKFRVTKSKVCQPFRDGYFIFYHPDLESKDKQVVFDDADELVSMLLIQSKIKRRGSWYDVLGKSFQGREELEKEGEMLKKRNTWKIFIRRPTNLGFLFS